MNAKKRKILLGILIPLGVIVVLFTAIDLFIGNYLVNYAIGRSGDGGDRNVSLGVEGPQSDIELLIAENKAIQNQRIEAFYNSGVVQNLTIKNESNTQIKAFYAFTEEPSDLWAITIHGYRGNHKKVDKLAERYYSNGFNVLSPDLNACGESEGNYVGMGWTDRKDILLWIDWILKQNPNAKIVVHGVSMGAATTMMVSGENTPDNVFAFVEDCGYTSVWDIFASELKLRFHLPTFPVLDTASNFSKIKAKYSFREASSLKQVKKCEKPMLFIHGNKDDFVPFEMMQILYDAKPGTNKKLIEVDEAGHDKATDVLGDKYWEIVFEFLKEYE